MNIPIAGRILEQARTEKRSALSEPEAKTLLAAFGIAVPNAMYLPPNPRSFRLDTLRPPLALKVVARSILHKTEIGGVCLGLDNEADISKSLDRMRADIIASGHVIDGWLLEEMAPTGVEMVVGGLHDKQFGPVVMCGLGGIFVELLQDINFAICPITNVDCDGMLETLQGWPLLHGWRGSAPLAIAAVHDALMRIGGPGGMFDKLGAQVAELDINPLIVSPKGAVAADARIILGI